MRQCQPNGRDFLTVPFVDKSSDDHQLRLRAAIDLLEKEFSYLECIVISNRYASKKWVLQCDALHRVVGV